MMEWLFWWRRKRLVAGAEPLRIAPPRDEPELKPIAATLEPVPAELVPTATTIVIVPVLEPVPEVAPPTVEPEPALLLPIAPPQVTSPQVTSPQVAPLQVTPEPLTNEERFRYFSPDVYAGFTAASARLVAPDAAFRALFNRPRPALASAATPPLAAPAPRQSPLPQTGIPLANVATASTTPAPSPGIVACLDPILFSAYITYPGTLAETFYLTEAKLLARAVQLRDRVLRNWQSGGEPLTPEAFLEAGMQIVGHAGTALVLCHNVSRALARGSTAIAWANRNRSRGEYFDGAKTWTAATVNRLGVLRPNALSPPSIFFLLFSARAFGVRDPGDWYRYFATVAIAAYTASRATAMPSAPGPDFIRDAQRLQTIAAEIALSNSGDSPQHRAMLWANTWTFHEWATWGRTQDSVDAAIAIAQRAVQAGLGATVPPWQWYVPRPGSLTPGSSGFPPDCVSRIVVGAGGAG